MKDTKKTKSQLIDELVQMRQRVAELEASEAERKRAEEALQESEERYKAMFDNRLQMVYINDGKGLFLDANDYALERLGYTRDDIRKVSFQDVVHPDDIPAVLQVFSEILTKGSMERSIEIRLVTKSGEIIWVETFGIPLERDVDHYIALGIAYDITERKRTEEALWESEERLRALIQNAPDAIYTNDLRGNFIGGNRKAEEMMGYSRQELTGSNFFEKGILPQEYVTKAIEALEKNRRGEPTGPDEFELVRKDGSRVVVEISTFPVNRGGEVEVMGIARDITERKRAEMELKVRDSAIASSINAIAMADLEGKLIYVNPSFLELWGYDNDKEVLGRPAIEFWEMGEQAAVVVQALFEKGGWRGELTAQRKNGSVFDVELSSSMVTDEYDKPFRLMASFIDITERKKAEETIKHLAYHDTLTGLPNRPLFNEILTLELARAQRNQQQVAVMLLDLDEFKHVNDTLGHPIGDQLLKAVADRMRRSVRKGDTVARMGGDEFML
ncbi:MAG: PAS domain S-box protein, partial [Dehalococcoidia bacterium]|nr:PAS domain S-box protein [Dehalococcoidia bacterium]